MFCMRVRQKEDKYHRDRERANNRETGIERSKERETRQKGERNKTERGKIERKER